MTFCLNINDFAREKYFSPPDFDLEIGTQFEESAASQEPGEASAPNLPGGPLPDLCAPRVESIAGFLTSELLRSSSAYVRELMSEVSL